MIVRRMKLLQKWICIIFVIFLINVFTACQVEERWSLGKECNSPVKCLNNNVFTFCSIVDGVVLVQKRTFTCPENYKCVENPEEPCVEEILSKGTTTTDDLNQEETDIESLISTTASYHQKLTTNSPVMHLETLQSEDYLKETTTQNGIEAQNLALTDNEFYFKEYTTDEALFTLPSSNTDAIKESIAESIYSTSPIFTTRISNIWKAETENNELKNVDYYEEHIPSTTPNSLNTIGPFIPQKNKDFLAVTNTSSTSAVLATTSNDLEAEYEENYYDDQPEDNALGTFVTSQRLTTIPASSSSSYTTTRPANAPDLITTISNNSFEEYEEVNKVNSFTTPYSFVITPSGHSNSISTTTKSTNSSDSLTTEFNSLIAEYKEYENEPEDNAVNYFLLPQNSNKQISTSSSTSSTTTKPTESPVLTTTTSNNTLQEYEEYYEDEQLEDSALNNFSTSQNLTTFIPTTYPSSSSATVKTTESPILVTSTLTNEEREYEEYYEDQQPEDSVVNNFPTTYPSLSSITVKTPVLVTTTLNNEEKEYEEYHEDEHSEDSALNNFSTSQNLVTFIPTTYPSLSSTTIKPAKSPVLMSTTLNNKEIEYEEYYEDEVLNKFSTTQSFTTIPTSHPSSSSTTTKPTKSSNTLKMKHKNKSEDSATNFFLTSQSYSTILTSSSSKPLQLKRKKTTTVLPRSTNAARRKTFTFVTPKRKSTTPIPRKTTTKLTKKSFTKNKSNFSRKHASSTTLKRKKNKLRTTRPMRNSTPRKKSTRASSTSLKTTKLDSLDEHYLISNQTTISDENLLKNQIKTTPSSSPTLLLLRQETSTNPSSVQTTLVASTTPPVTPPMQCIVGNTYPAKKCNQFYKCVEVLWWTNVSLQTCPSGHPRQAYDDKTKKCVDISKTNCKI